MLNNNIDLFRIKNSPRVPNLKLDRTSVVSSRPNLSFGFMCQRHQKENYKTSGYLDNCGSAMQEQIPLGFANVYLHHAPLAGISTAV